MLDERKYGCFNCCVNGDIVADYERYCKQCVSNADDINSKPSQWIDGEPNEENNTKKCGYIKTNEYKPRNAILDKAKTIINGERQGTYGKPEDSFSVISLLWSAYLGRDLTTADVINMMILMKVARNSSGVYKDDNWVDICGYAAIGGELQSLYGEKEE